MNKAEFLAKLDARIAVLTEVERRDILDEYEQHIDMKVAEGLSEEEATEEFGDLDDLTADILEAYHVRADFGAQEQREEGHSIQRGLSHGLEETGRFFRKAAAAARTACAKAWAGLLGFFLWFGRSCQRLAHRFFSFCKRPFADRRKKQGETGLPSDKIQEERQAEPLPGGSTSKKNGFWEKQRRKREEKYMEDTGRVSFGSRVKRGLQTCWSGCAGVAAFCWNVVLGCAAVCWNLACIGAGTFLGIGACLVLFCLGTLAVILTMGYPVAGVTLGCLGLTLCLGAAVAFCFALCVGLKREKDGLRNTVLKRRRIWIVTGIVFVIGILAGGIGTGIAFGEYSSLEYAGRVTLGEMATETMDFVYTPVEGKKLMLAYCEGGDYARATLVEQDRTVPQDVIRYEVTYNRQAVAPYLYYAQADASGNADAAADQAGVLYLRRRYIGNEFELFMENKDEILAQLKEGKLSSYQMAGITQIRVLVNPSMMEFIEDQTR